MTQYGPDFGAAFRRYEASKSDIIVGEELARTVTKTYPKGQIPSEAFGVMGARYTDLDQALRHLTASTIITNRRMAETSQSMLKLEQGAYNLGINYTVLNTAFKLLSIGINDLTLSGLKGESRARGELSKALELEKQSYLKGIPIIGQFAQALSELSYQRAGTEYTARAAGVLEQSIPQTRQMIDITRVGIAKGGLAAKWWTSPETQAYQEQMLAIQTGPYSELQSIRGGRAAAYEQHQQAERELKAASAAGQVNPFEPWIENPFRKREAETREFYAKFWTPGVLAREKELSESVDTLKSQAGEAYRRSFYQGMSVTSAPTWAGVGVAARIREGVPNVDPIVTGVTLTNTLLQNILDALHGINPGLQ